MINRIYIEKFLSDEDFKHYFSLVSNQKVMAMVTERAIALDEARSSFKLLLERNKRHKAFGSFKVFETTNVEYSITQKGRAVLPILRIENIENIAEK